MKISSNGTIRLLAFLALLAAYLPFTSSAAFGQSPAQPGGSHVAFYVSPQGDDDNAGSKGAPFETLEGARDAIRTLQSGKGLPDGGVTVYLREGTYERTDSFRLEEQDSGTTAAPITYRAYENEHVSISGGTVLAAEAFESVTNAAVRERLPQESRDDVVQYDLAAHGINDYGEILQVGFGLPSEPGLPELYFNDEAMTLSRYPNTGYTTIGTVDDPGARPRSENESWTRPLPPIFDDGATFEYSGDEPSTWTNTGDIWMYGFWFNNWADGNLRIESIDTDTNRITTATASQYSVRSGQRYYYYNIVEELDTPGEYYLDRTDGVLYFYAPSSLTDSKIELSLLTEPLVAMSDTSNISFVGISFEVSRGNGIDVSGGTNNLIRKSTLAKLGGRAIDVQDGTFHGVTESQIHVTGQGGIRLRGGDRNSLTAGKHYAENNVIHDYSRLAKTYHPAISLSGVGNRAAHNHIYDAPHQAIALSGNNHVVEYNDIHDVLQETSDAGAIYSGRDWSMQGTVIRYNYIHDIVGAEDQHGKTGVYLDDEYSGTVIYGNVFNNVFRALLIGGGRSNTVENNIILDSGQFMQLDARGLGWAQESLCENILPDRLADVPYQGDLWRTRYPRLADVLDDDPCAPKYNSVQKNVIHDTPAPEGDIVNVARQTGVVENNWVTEEDLGFVDEEGGDLQLRSDSSVFEHVSGFEAIPFAKIGVHTDEDQLAYLGELLQAYSDSSEITGHLERRLTQRLRRAEAHSANGRLRNATRVMDSFVELLDNPRRQSDVSEEAQTVLTKEAKALIAMWSEDALARIRMYSPRTTLEVDGPSAKVWTMGDSLTGRYIDLFDVVKFRSEDPDVAEVERNGMVTAASPGETTLTAEANLGGLRKDSSIDLTIEPPAPPALDIGLDDWEGTPKPSTDQVRVGANSYVVDEDLSSITHRTGEDTNGVVTAWFYDDASDLSLVTMANVGHGTEVGEWRGLGVHTEVSEAQYVYRTTGEQPVETEVSRTTGWHEFKWDYTSGEHVDMYIDGEPVVTIPDAEAFSVIELGDWWADGRTGPVYFDDVSIGAPVLDIGLGDWEGNPKPSTDQVRVGANSQIVDEDTSVISHHLDNDSNGVVTAWFYDNASDSSLVVMANVGHGAANGEWRALGVHTEVSTDRYIYRTTGQPTAATDVPRTTGWHEFKWDYTSGEHVDMYIDDELVATIPDSDAFSVIQLGDWWADARTGPVYFDDVSISD